MGSFQTRQVVVMKNQHHRVYVPDADVVDSMQYPTIVLAEGVWHDMGKPETITITIEVGDTLNPDARREAFQTDTSLRVEA